jgi:hypothetical protein
LAVVAAKREHRDSIATAKSGVIADFFALMSGSVYALDWLAEDAVRSEPVSTPNSLLTGK